MPVRDAWIGNGFSLTPDGSQVAFIASGPSEFPDVYVAPVQTMAARKLSDAGAQIASWPKHTREVIKWKSQDGAEIEGVLHKPADFQPGRRYPLLVVIHGGPTGVSRPVPYGSYYCAYPIDAFLREGRARARAQLPRQRRLRREVPFAQRAEPRHRRRLGRAVGHRRAGAAGHRRSRPRRQHGLEPGRLHLRIPDHEAFRSIQGDFGRRRHFGLDDVLRQHRHSPVHAAVPQGHAVG